MRDGRHNYVFSLLLLNYNSCAKDVLYVYIDMVIGVHSS